MSTYLWSRPNRPQNKPTMFRKRPFFDRRSTIRQRSQGLSCNYYIILALFYVSALFVAAAIVYPWEV